MRKTAAVGAALILNNQSAFEEIFQTGSCSKSRDPQALGDPIGIRFESASVDQRQNRIVFPLGDNFVMVLFLETDGAVGTGVRKNAGAFHKEFALKGRELEPA